MATPPDGLPMLIRPLPFTTTQLSHYQEDLRLPPTARYACHQVAPLDQLERRLGGWLWNVFGVVVDPTPDNPTYPFLRLETESGVIGQMQVWLWQICPIGAAHWAELRWRPQEEPTVSFVHLSVDAQTRRGQLAALDSAVKLTMYTISRGRPLGSRSRGGVNDEAFLAQIVELVQACWRDGERPTEGRVVQMFPGGVGHRSLQRFVHDQLGMLWDHFIEKYRPR